MSKRKRDPAFATSEKMVLIKLVANHFSLIECKKTDAATMKLKNECWHSITEEFNSIIKDSTSRSHARDWVALKNCWENLKKRAKHTMRNQHFLKTEGGPQIKVVDDPTTERVLDVLQMKSDEGFDSDASGSNAPSQELIQPHTNDRGSQVQHQDNNKPIETTTEEVDVSWPQCPASELKEDKNPLVRLRSPPLEMQLCVEELPDTNLQDTQCHQTPRTLTRAHSANDDTLEWPVAITATSTRKRKILRRERETQSLTGERIKYLGKANEHAEDEHSVQMSILRIQEQKEKEMLEQEKLKTAQERIRLEILELELKKLKD